jgi:hypothetical protein
MCVLGIFEAGSQGPIARTSLKLRSSRVAGMSHQCPAFIYLFMFLFIVYILLGLSGIGL